MTELHIKDLGPVGKALEKAARTDSSTAKSVVPRYVQMRPGIQDKLEAERHHLLTGRRGTGKSTLLFVLREHLASQGIPVVTLDMERFNGRDYPDVLIEVLIRLLQKIRPKLIGNKPVKRIKLRARIRRLEAVLRVMLSDPQRLTRTVSRSRLSESTGSIDATIQAMYKAQKGAVAAKAAKSRSEATTAVGEYEELKIERLQSLANDISHLLKSVIDTVGGGQAIVFLDDYYFVPYDDQPSVLAYLHQICKGTGVWLKVGGVGSRLNPYLDGQPPVGMELGQDISEVALDVTLADFSTAKRFLEDVLRGVLAPHTSPEELFTEDARDRMVLACGGAVARDYINLTGTALDEAIERSGKNGAYTDETIIKIWTVDIQSAAKKLMNTKEKEAFQRDAGSDASLLSNRWRDVCDFVRTTVDMFILVPQADLERESYGKEIQDLENLRLVHRVKDTIPNSRQWQGVKTMVFMIDLGQLPNVRLSRKIPEFWKSVADFNTLRKGAWVYTPDWRDRQQAISASSVRSRPSDNDGTVQFTIPKDTAPEGN